MQSGAQQRTRARAAVARLPKRYRRALKSRTGRRLDADLKLSRELVGSGVFATQVRPETINTTTTVRDTGRSKVVKTVKGTGESEGGSDTAADVTVTVETTDTDKQNGLTLQARRTHRERSMFRTDACPDGDGKVSANFLHSQEMIENYPDGRGGRVVIRTFAEWKIDVVAQVGGDAKYQHMDYTVRAISDRAVQTSASALKPLQTQERANGTARDAGRVPDFDDFRLINPSATSSTGLGASEALYELHSLAAIVIQKEVGRNLRDRQSRWFNDERCAKLDADPAALTLERGQTAASTAKLTIEGRPLSKPISVTPSGPVTAVPTAAQGPQTALAITLGAESNGSISLESVSNQGRGTARIDITAKRQPPPPPPAPGPAHYAGTVSGSITDSSTNTTISFSGTVSMAYNARFPAGQGSAPPPGDYWYYAPESGTINASISKPAADANDCSWSGQTSLAVPVGMGDASSVQADDPTPAYFLLGGFGPSQQIPFTKTGPVNCAGLGQFPLFGFAYLFSVDTQQSGSTALTGNAVRAEGGKTETWNWNLSPQP